MAMKLSDFKLLKKIMDRTRSENDAEALASLRAANRIIEKSGVTWERFFDRSVKVEYEADTTYQAEENPEPGPKAKVTETDEERRVREAFAMIEEHDEKRYGSEFIQSLLSQWETRRWLSESQKKHLFRNADRARR